MKFQITNSKGQINSNDQKSKFQTKEGKVLFNEAIELKKSYIPLLRGVRGVSFNY
ncbi:MAG: hypothetical protein AB1414_08665 [bacterium]